MNTSKVTAVKKKKKLKEIFFYVWFGLAFFCLMAYQPL